MKYKNKLFAHILLLVAFDQAAKYLVRSNMYLGESIPVAPFLSLTYLTNTGIAFSMFQGANAVFALFTLAVLVFFFLWYRKNKNILPKILSAAFVLISAGALGNLIDRLFLGHVTDFIDVSFGSYHWPAFNVADSCISIGAVLLFIAILKTPKRPVEA